jgi:RNA polymerase sigma factor (sigma-70 family)
MATAHWPRPEACKRIVAGGVVSVNDESAAGDDGGQVLNVAHAPAGAAKAVPAASVDRFDAVFSRFYAELYGIAHRVLGDRMQTEDTLQEAFLKLKLAQAEDRVLARPDAEVGAWLRRVTLNLSFNQLRSERRARGRLERVGRLELPERQRVDAPHGVVERREEQAAVRRALAELPDRQRECLLLRHSGYSYAEIAATLEIAVGSVGVLLARAEQAFRVIYRRHTQP